MTMVVRELNLVRRVALLECGRELPIVNVFAAPGLEVHEYADAIACIAMDGERPIFIRLGAYDRRSLH